MSDCTNDTKSIRLIEEHLGNIITEPTQTGCDNQGALDITNTDKVTPMAKHLDRRVLMCREWRAAGIVAFRKLNTALNPADYFTKILERQPFQRWRQYWSGMPSSTVANFIKSLWITARTSRTRRGNKA